MLNKFSFEEMMVQKRTIIGEVSVLPAIEIEIRGPNFGMEGHQQLRNEEEQGNRMKN